ncbi:hypothetical protein ACFUTR_23610 [Streptomyces sp. NPDC057367]|uniref:hypothetical protein n=1 Tax=Streptomyces sp. NPDC057367 TaxID=3346108 RepID=UPI0036430AEA
MSTHTARQGIYNVLTGRAVCPAPRPDDEAEGILDAYRAEVVAERDTQFVAWLLKRSREDEHGEVIARLASKVQRGAVRPNNLRTDFFQPGRTYAFAEYRFRCEYIATHPAHGGTVAWGWFGRDGAWRHTSFSRRQFEVRTWADITEGGEES